MLVATSGKPSGAARNATYRRGVRANHFTILSETTVTLRDFPDDGRPVGQLCLRERRTHCSDSSSRRLLLCAGLDSGVVRPASCPATHLFTHLNHRERMLSDENRCAPDRHRIPCQQEFSLIIDKRWPTSAGIQRVRGSSPWRRTISPGHDGDLGFFMPAGHLLFDAFSRTSLASGICGLHLVVTVRHITGAHDVPDLADPPHRPRVEQAQRSYRLETTPAQRLPRPAAPSSPAHELPSGTAPSPSTPRAKSTPSKPGPRTHPEPWLGSGEPRPDRQQHQDLPVCRRPAARRRGQELPEFAGRPARRHSTQWRRRSACTPDLIVETSLVGGALRRHSSSTALKQPDRVRPAGSAEDPTGRGVSVRRWPRDEHRRVVPFGPARRPGRRLSCRSVTAFRSSFPARRTTRGARRADLVPSEDLAPTAFALVGSTGDSGGGQQRLNSSAPSGTRECLGRPWSRRTFRAGVRSRSDQRAAMYGIGCRAFGRTIRAPPDPLQRGTPRVLW